MCFKKIFGNNNHSMQKVELRTVTLGRNKYGGGNDLAGCVKDSKSLASFCTAWNPAFDIKMFLDYQVTASNYLKAGAEAISLLDPGATVLVLLDSCFSGTATRVIKNNPHLIKNRFFDPGLPPVEKLRSRVAKADEIKWIAMSACMENQTAADAYIDGGYCGAFTYYALKSLRKGMTYIEWYQTIRHYLPGNGYDQAPTIEGPYELLNRKVFEGQTLVIHNSSHGSWTVDQHGDESDGRDEGLYFDRLLLDDEVNQMLQKIPMIS